MTSLEDGARGPGLPVVKRTALGQTFVGALVSLEQRDVLKTVNGVQQKQLKPDGKARQELVLTCMAMPGTTAPAGIGDTTAIPAPGDLVRVILRGAAFGQWIEVKKAHDGLATGDVVTQVTEYGQVYDANGNPSGGKLTVQAQLDAVPRHQSLGVYGTLTLRKPTPDEAPWASRADQAHHARKTTTPLADGSTPNVAVESIA